MYLFKPFAPASRTWAAALVITLGAPLAMAQVAPSPVQTPAQAPIPGAVQAPPQGTVQVPAPASASASTPVQVLPHAPGKSVSGRVSAPANESAAAAPSSATTPSSLASDPTPAAEPSTEAPPTPTPAPDSGAAEPTNTSDGTDWLAVFDPRSQPIVGAGALLALMLVVAVLVYRRNRRADARALSLPSSADDEPQEAADPLQPTRGLQPEIMALDLELDASLSPLDPPEPLAPESASAPAAPRAEDLTLSKLEWAEKLLAAGENELARMLLTSVATTLKSQLQQPSNPDQGSHP